MENNLETPEVRIFINNGVLHIGMKLKKNRQMESMTIDVDMEELTALSPSDGAFRIGSTVISFLRIFQSEDFGDWAPPPVFKGSPT